MMSNSLMKIKRVAQQGTTHPFGDHRSVKQAFPSGIPTAESDPFLMCDYFDMTETEGPVTDPDDFPIGWHPHRGFDICTYLKTGLGRHADSLGNRETFETPGMQWVSTGSGVEHAEGGATEKGVAMKGFQIWVNVPSEKKMDDPRYGTVPTKDLPAVDLVKDGGDGGGATARVLAGSAFGITGPFQTVQPILMLDIELGATHRASIEIPVEMDTTILYVYEGSLSFAGSTNSPTSTSSNSDSGILKAGSIILFDASSRDERIIQVTAAASGVTAQEEESVGGCKTLLFAGKKLREPVAWHGPIVMNTQEQLKETFQQLRSGDFPPIRADWDYKRIATKPK